jgi:lipopolysaccharide transport system permease protein
MQKRCSQTLVKATSQMADRPSSSGHAAALENEPQGAFAPELPVTVYTPESPLRHPTALFRAMGHDLLASRELAWRLFLRDTRARYRQSLLGYLWVFIPPLLSSVPFIFLNAQGVIKIGETPLPYAAYALIGTMIWQVFVDALNSPLNAVSGARAMLTRIKFPREAILLSGLMQVGFSFLVRLLLLAIVFVWFSLVPPLTAVLFPLGILALVVTGFSLGLLLTPLGLLYSDVQRLVTIITPLLMFLTPVLYPMPTSGFAVTLVSLNPLTPLVVNTRNWLTLGTTTSLVGFIVVTLAMVILFLFAWIAFRVALPHLIVRLGS